MAERAPIRYSTDGDGIITLSLDNPDSSANVMDDAFCDSFHDVICRLEGDRHVLTGVILTSAKKTFFAGADLRRIAAETSADAPVVAARASRTKNLMRRLETLGIPVVAAINGSALGGGAELTLCCHHRIVIDDPRTRIGFPEVTLGLLPGGGGIARACRLLGLVPALEHLLLDGQTLDPRPARDLGLVDELAVDQVDLMKRARRWIAAHPDERQPWDKKGFAFPGGDGRTRQITAVIPELSANLRRRLNGSPLIAPHHVLCAAVEGSLVDIDTALEIETRYYVDLVTGQVSANMIQGLFLDRREVARSARRSKRSSSEPFQRVAVVSAGTAGIGIAQACAQAGLQVLLLDSDLDASSHGKSLSDRLLQEGTKGAATDPVSADAFARIVPCTSLEALASCDAVVEAASEDPVVKQDWLAAIQEMIQPGTLLVSSTGTASVNELAAGLRVPSAVVGMHFLSPVNSAEVVEIIRGRDTSDDVLSAGIVLARQIAKIPIVVREGQDLFLRRLLCAYIREGVGMLAEGMPATSINQASLRAGYATPLLELQDELSLTFPAVLGNEATGDRVRAAGPPVRHPSDAVLETMISLGRVGRDGGGGFYSYTDGTRSGLWAGLEAVFGAADPQAIPFQDAVDRLLVAQAVDALRCLDEGVIATAAEANVGSLLGIGFPKWTGGVIQYINGHANGPAGFLTRAQELSVRYGHRFEPPSGFVSMARQGKLVG